jgi:membrane protease YdiL (CAAX protease family)
MMRCPSCKSEYAAGSEHCADCDLALVEEAPEEIAAVVPAAPPAAARKLRWLELALVLSVGFLLSIVYSLHSWWKGTPPPPLDSLTELGRILEAALSISVLAYVLYRQGRSLGKIGLTARLSDLPLALLLGFFSVAFTEVVGHMLAPYLATEKPVPSSSHIGLLLWLAVVPGAAKEELLVRAFLITEVSELTGNVALAVLASIGVQTLYHLYQGPAYALWAASGFFVTSVFYASTRRITPVILVHAIHNFWVFGRWGSH